MGAFRAYLLAACLPFGFGCAQAAQDLPPTSTQPAAEAVPSLDPDAGRRILIMHSQMVDPAKEIGGINAMLAKLFQTYGGALRDALAELGQKPQILVNEDFRVTAGDFLARAVAKAPQDKVIQVSFWGEQTPAGGRTLMETVCLPLEYDRVADGRRVVRLKAGYEKKYVLFDPAGDDLRDKPLPEIAREFVQELRSKGLLPPPKA